MNISIDREKCTDCGRCAQVCGLNFIEGGDGKISVIEPPYTCILCGHCKAVCPMEAIEHTGLSAACFDRIVKKPSYAELMSLLEARRSRREFTEKPLTEEEISSLLSAAAQAPNGCNKRNVGYIVVTDPKVLKELSLSIGKQTGWLADKLASPLWRPLLNLFYGRQLKEFEPLLPLLKPMAEETLKGNDMVLWKAPCAILLHTSPHDSCGAEDAVYCGANILLAAESLGLGACVLGFLTEPVNRDRKLAELVRLPKGRVVRTSMCVGHPSFAYCQGVRRPLPDFVRV
ncbi:MAG: nitroreductase family protein [Elusimicrobiota bacterium]|jgi:nitroreductase/NAD-dependent dihydropyrimidine dehydrogenase PreA subunit